MDVFGPTECENPKKKVNGELYQYLVTQDASPQSRERPGNKGGLKQPQTRLRQDAPSNQQDDDGWVELDADTRVIVLGDDAEENALQDVDGVAEVPDVQPEVWEVQEVQEQTPGVSDHGTVHFEFDPDMERLERDVFGPKQKTEPHGTMSFVVPG